MTTKGIPEFQVHIVGHFCENHEPLIQIFRVDDSGPLAKLELVATFPDGEDRVVSNEIQRLEYDLQGRDIPTRIIPGIMGMEELQGVMDREVLRHTRDSDEWVAKMAIGNLVGVLLDGAGEMAGPYL